MPIFNGVDLGVLGWVTSGVRGRGSAEHTSVAQVIPGMRGELPMGSNTGIRSITVTGTLVGATSLADVRVRESALFAALTTETACALVFEDEPDVVYYAKMEGSVELEDAGLMRKGTITFRCSDPARYAAAEVAFDLVEGDTTITNPGTAPVTPRIEATFATPATFLRATLDGRYMQIGVPAQAGVTAMPAASVMLHDDCSSLTGWSAGTQGPLGGSMGCNGTFFSPKYEGGAWGTPGAGYIGPSIQRAFPMVDGSYVAQDFAATVQLRIDNRVAAKATGNARYSMNTLYAYCMDASGNVVATMQMGDLWHYVQQMRADFTLAGGPVGGLMNTLGPKSDSYNNFQGYIFVSRIGNYWTARTARLSASGESQVIQANYTDTANAHMAPIARIELRTAAYMSVPVCASAWFDQVDVVRYNNVTAAPAVNVVNAGDTLVIDGAQVRRNGASIAVNRDPKGDPLLSPPGDSDLTLSTDGTLTSASAFILPAWL